MRYSDNASLDAVYGLIATFADPGAPEPDRLEEMMIISSALIELGEDRSWASVWWAYGAIHHEMSDEALARALDLLGRVEVPPEACAAALMLRAEIEFTKAIYAGSSPNADEQRALLSEAVSLAPDWPALRVRLARACKGAGEAPAAREHAAEAMRLLDATGPTPDPYDSALTGRNLDREYVAKEVETIVADDPA